MFIRTGNAAAFWIAAAFLLTPTAQAETRPRAAVLAGEGEPAEAVRTIPGLLRQELAGAYAILNDAEWAALPPEAAACSSDVSCLRRALQGKPVDALVTSRLAPEGKGYRLTVTLHLLGAPEGDWSESETMRQLKSLPANVTLCVTRLLQAHPARAAAAENDLPPIPPPELEPLPTAAPQRPPPTVEAAPTGERHRVMVLALKSTEEDATVATQLTSALAEAIGQHAGYDVASVDEVKGLLALDKTRQLVGCESDAACLTEITKKLNAELIVNGSIGRLGSSQVLSLSLIDAKTPGAAKRASDSYESIDALKKGLPATLGKLFGWSGTEAVAQFHLPKGKKSSFAIFDLTANGVPPEVARNLTQVLSSEVKNVEGTSVVSRDDIVALLQFDKQKAELGCTEDTACMAEIGGALGVDRLVVGSVGKVADDFVIALRLIDARHATVENRQTESFRGGEDQLIGATRHACRALLGLQDLPPGAIAVTASQTAAEVFVDNEKKGKLPLPPIASLAAGRHSVRLTRDGFFDWQGDIYVSPFETTGAWAQLKERPEKWYQKWWVWTVAGVVIAGTVTAVVVATRPAPTVGGGDAFLQ